MLPTQAVVRRSKTAGAIAPRLWAMENDVMIIDERLQLSDPEMVNEVISCYEEDSLKLG
jgi:ABC-type histidine transport system ATPase subunit